MDRVEYRKHRAAEHIRRILNEERTLLKSVMYQRVGKGLRESDLDEIVQDLHASGVLTISLSKLGRERLELVQE